MKKLFAVTILCLVLLAPVFAKAAVFTGTVQGFMCVTEGKTCPIGKEDALASVENVFVLLVDAAKGEYYLLPNVSREFLVRYINTQIKVSGDLNKPFKSITVKEIHAMKGKTEIQVWSYTGWDLLYKAIHE